MLCATCRQFHRTAAERYKETLEKERSLWDAERTQMLQDAQVRVVAHFHVPPSAPTRANPRGRLRFPEHTSPIRRVWCGVMLLLSGILL